MRPSSDIKVAGNLASNERGLGQIECAVLARFHRIVEWSTILEVCEPPSGPDIRTLTFPSSWLRKSHRERCAKLLIIKEPLSYL